MPSNLPSSFASAAAGQNANRDARAGRGDGRGGGGDWYVVFLLSFASSLSLGYLFLPQVVREGLRIQSRRAVLPFPIHLSPSMPLSRPCLQNPTSLLTHAINPIPSFHHHPAVAYPTNTSYRIADTLPFNFAGPVATAEPTARLLSVVRPPRLAPHPTLPPPPTPLSLPKPLSRPPAPLATTTPRRNLHSTPSSRSSTCSSSLPASTTSRTFTSRPGRPGT
jgi:hypothetical protein